MNMMRIVEIVASVDEEAAGPSYSVPRLSQSVAALGHEVDLVSLGLPETRNWAGVRHTRYAWDLKRAGPLVRLGVSQTMRRALRQASADIFHTHGLWMMPNIYPAEAAFRHGRPFILSPRGMLGAESLRFSALLKRGFWAMAQGRAARQVTCFHATSEQELEDIRAFGLRQPVAVIPNGIDLPTANEPTGISRLGRRRTLLYLGRVHPKKGLERLVDAWGQLEALHPDWELRIVGPSELDHASQLKARASSLSLTRISFEDSLFGKAKLAAYKEADLFVLPTLNENFGMVVAEALANGTPVVSTRGAPWGGLVKHGCGWWIDHGVEPLVATLTSAMAMDPAVLNAMGARGRAWMKRDFTWDGIAANMEQVYLWCLNRADQPHFVTSE